MKITKTQLSRIIKEEKARLLSEFGARGTDGASTLIDFAHAYSGLGNAIQEQIEQVVAAYINFGGGDQFVEVVYDQNPNALEQAYYKLGNILNRFDSDEANDVLEALESAKRVYDQDGEPLVGPTNEGPGQGSKFDVSDEHAGDIDNVEYERGYQDGLDGYPVADDATLDYDAGYEDGSLDAQLPEPGPPPSPEEEAAEEMRYAAGRPSEHN